MNIASDPIKSHVLSGGQGSYGWGDFLSNAASTGLSMGESALFASSSSDDGQASSVDFTAPVALNEENTITYMSMQGTQDALKPPPDYITIEEMTEAEVISTRKKIVENATAKIGSEEYNYYASIDNFGTKTNKCNKFVFDILEESGASPGTPNGNDIKKHFGMGYPPVANQWADKSNVIDGWEVVDDPMPGDVAAERIDSYSDATGHVAIVTAPNTTVGTIGLEDSQYYNKIGPGNFGFRSNQAGKITFRRFVGHKVSVNIHGDY